MNVICDVIRVLCCADPNGEQRGEDLGSERTRGRLRISRRPCANANKSSQPSLRRFSALPSANSIHFSQSRAIPPPQPSRSLYRPTAYSQLHFPCPRPTPATRARLRAFESIHFKLPLATHTTLHVLPLARSGHVLLHHPPAPLRGVVQLP